MRGNDECRMLNDEFVSGGMFEETESGYRLRKKRMNKKGDVSKWTRRLLSYYLLLVMDLTRFPIPSTWLR